MIGSRIAVLVTVALVLQLELFSWFTFDGSRPEVMILLVLAVGYLIGPEQGAVIGYAAGLALDVFLATPLGLTAFIYTIAGYVVGQLSPALLRSSWWFTSLVLAAGSGITMVVYGVVGEVLGLDTFDGPPLGTIVTVVALVNLALAPLAIKAVQWARIGDRTRRRHSVFS